MRVYSRTCGRNSKTYSELLSDDIFTCRHILLLRKVESRAQCVIVLDEVMMADGILLKLGRLEGNLRVECVGQPSKRVEQWGAIET